MAQVGRISGPLLEANLERNGIDLAFRNDLDTVQLLYLDVNSGRIAINRATASADLDVTNTTIQTINLIGDTAPIANFTFSANNIDASTGNIFLNASEAIVLSNLETEEFFVSDNRISTVNLNTDIELRPNGTGTLEVFNDLRVYGDLHATGNITLDGTITFGNSLVQDTVTFDSDINSDILPDDTDTYALGSVLKRWNDLYTLQINGSLVTAGGATAAGIDLNKRLEYTLYVATNGNDTNVGDHIQGPLATIQEAISRIPSSNTNFYTVYVFPGTYAEQLPLVVPPYVTIAGNDIRNTIVVPAVGYEDKDVFQLNGQTTVQNLTVKNFYYNSTNNTGYAFRFASNGVITSRSPYVQNVSVITQGSTTGVNDPRGFIIGDAGRGAYIDGAELSSASFDASMLFHSVTMITPGVDAVTMTNGVRVEWLNSFTYFANRGLYAVNGVAGRTSQDGSTVNRGAEIRSIGSASVYGNFGAVADGDDTLMYLITHNFAYIGTGKDVSNDKTLAVQSQETVELNSGKIYYQTQDHTGTFRVGDNFFVDFDRGTTSVDISTLTTNSLSGLVINTGTDTTTITGSKLETGNIRVSGNLIQSLTGELNIVGATGEINLLDDTNISADLDITGNFSFDGTLNLSGNEVTDGLRFNVEFEQDFNPNQHLQFSLGTPSKQWLAVYLNRLEAGDFSVYDNVIETNVTNANLELRANGTGVVRVSDSVTFSNALDVAGTTTLDDTLIQGTFNLTGNLIQSGNTDISSDVTASQNLTVGASARFEEVLIDDNVITSTTSNARLELRANGSGTVNIQESAQIQQNLSVDNITAQANVDVTLNISADNAAIGNVELNDNYIQTTGLNQSLTLESTQNVTASVDNVTLSQALSVQGATDLQTTVITGLISHTGNRTQTGDYDIAGELFVDQILIEDNFITSLTSNTNLVLSADGIGSIFVPINDVEITNNLTVSGITDLQNTTITGLLTQTGNRQQTGNYNIAGEFTNGNVLIEDNFITTTILNLDLELRANGTGTILIPSSDVEIINDLTVGLITDIQSSSITGTLTHTGDRIQSGNYSQLGNLDITGNIDVNSSAQFTDIKVSGNTLTTTLGNNDLILNADGNGIVLIQADVIVDNNLSTRSITVTGDIVIDQDLDIENISIPPSIIDIGDNYISTKVSNTDLELRANGTGVVSLTVNDVEFSQNLTVSGTTDLQSTVITGSLTHAGNRTQVGDYDQTGNLTVNGEASISNTALLDDIRIDQNNLRSTNGNLVLTASGTGLVTFSALSASQNLIASTLTAGNIVINNTLALEVLESSTDIQLFDNVITTTNSNSNLELRANGTGNIELQSLKFNTSTISSDTDDITFSSATNNVIIDATGALKIPVGTTEQLIVEDIEVLDGGSAILTGNLLDGGNALTIFTSSNTIYNAGSSIVSLTGAIGSLRFNTSDSVFEGFTGGAVTFNGVYSSDRKTNVLAHPTNNTLLFTINQIPVGTVSATGLTIHGLQTNDILFNNNRISTTVNNSNLALQSNGTGELTIDNLSIKDNLIKNNSTPIIITSTGFGYSKLATTVGVVVPTGTDAERPAPETPPQTGDTRFNTDDEVLEVWDGSTYIAASGTSATISESEFNDLVLEYTLILG